MLNPEGEFLGLLTPADIVENQREGIFGHRITLLDFSPEHLAYFRQIGKLVEFLDEPGIVETALVLSGSAAQSRIQTYPGDADFFERVNIKAPTRAAACQVLSRRKKPARTRAGAKPGLVTDPHHR